MGRGAPTSLRIAAVRAAAIAACVAVPWVSSSARADDVWLASGERVHGTIIEASTSGAVRVRTEGGTIREAKAADVDRLEYDDGITVDFAGVRRAGAASGRPAPLPPSSPPPAPPPRTAIPEYAARPVADVDRRPRRNRGLFAAGIAMTAVGSAALGIGTLIMMSTSDSGGCGKGDSECTAGAFAMLGGVLVTAPGIAMMVIGGQRVGPKAVAGGDAQTTPRWVPRVAFGGRRVAFDWSF